MAYRRRYFTTETPVTTQVIAQGAVTTQKIYDRTILSEDIGRGEVKAENIGAGAVRLQHLGSDVPAIGIVDGSITEAKLANDAVAAAKIKDGAVISGKLGASAVTAVKIATDAVETAKIKDAAVTPAKLSFTPGAGYVPRKAVAIDKTMGDLIRGGGTQINGLDLSGIIPAGAKGVILDVWIASLTPTDEFHIFVDSVAYPETRIYMTAVLPLAPAVGHYILPCEPDRLFDYDDFSADFQMINITVLGWFI